MTTAASSVRVLPAGAAFAVAALALARSSVGGEVAVAVPLLSTAAPTELSLTSATVAAVEEAVLALLAVVSLFVA